MENTSQDWARLAEALRTRRERLGLSQYDIAAAGGPSHQTLRNLEQAKPAQYQSRTFSSLEKILGWGKGTIADILAGVEWVDPDEVLPGTPTVSRLGIKLLEACHQYFGSDPELAALQKAVLDFLYHIQPMPNSVSQLGSATKKASHVG